MPGFGASKEAHPGDILAGKYKVERILGRGGMGQVLLATHVQLQQRVAIKTLLPDALQSPTLVARFSQEARSTVKIQSEHVVRVLDVGALDSGAPFMVMEYLEGADLAQLLKQRGALPLIEVVEYVLQACEALAQAHKLGIIHRDLKPANLFLTSRADGSPVVKVLDFGISKATLSGAMGGASNLTQTSAVMGSPSYMSPEQLKNSKDVTERTDIWSLGIVLYELLIGRSAFEAETLAELHVAILQAFPPPPTARRPDLPRSIEQVILKCIHKDPAHRFSNVAELAVALAEHAPARALVSVERTCKVLGVTAPQRAPVPVSHAQSASMSQSAAQSSSYHPAQAPLANLQQGYASQSGYAPAPAQPAPWAPQLPSQSQAIAPWNSHPGGLQWTHPQQQPTRASSGPSAAVIVLIILVACVVLGMGGCMTCMCIGALG